VFVHISFHKVRGGLNHKLSTSITRITPPFQADLETIIQVNRSNEIIWKSAEIIIHRKKESPPQMSRTQNKYPFHTLDRNGSRTVTTSTSEGSNPISSFASLVAVSKSSLSLSSTFPPGKETSPSTKNTHLVEWPTNNYHLYLSSVPLLHFHYSVTNMRKEKQFSISSLY